MGVDGRDGTVESGRAGSVTRMQMSGAHNAVITVTDNGVSGPSLHRTPIPTSRLPSRYRFHLTSVTAPKGLNSID